MNKQIISGIIIVIIIAGVFIGFSVWQNQQIQAQKQANLIQEIDRNLTEEDIQIYQDRLIEAEKYIVEATNDQDKHDALIYKAVILQGLGKLAQARDVFLEAAELVPENYNVFVHLYQVYLEMNDYEQAEKSIQKSLELQPNNPDAWKKYIILERERFDRQQSEIRKLYLEAEEKTKPNTDILTDYATYLESIGDTDTAIEYWRKAQKAQPEDYEIYNAEIKRLEK